MPSRAPSLPLPELDCVHLAFRRQQPKLTRTEQLAESKPKWVSTLHSLARTSAWRIGTSLLYLCCERKRLRGDHIMTSIPKIPPPQHPAGEYVADLKPSPAKRAEMIAMIERLPAEARAAVAGLTT